MLSNKSLVSPTDTYFVTPSLNVEQQNQRQRKRSAAAIAEPVKQMVPISVAEIEGQVKDPTFDSGVTRKKMRVKKSEKEETAGPGWYNMKPTEMTEEVKKDLEILALRNYIDPKRHYKANDLKKGIPKYFQVGTVVAPATEYYSNRVVKKDQKPTLVDSLLADEQFVKYTKRQYLKAQSKNQSGTRHRHRDSGKKGKKGKKLPPRHKKK